MPQSEHTCAVCQRSRTRGLRNLASDLFICAECDADAKQFIEIQEWISVDAGEVSESADDSQP